MIATLETAEPTAIDTEPYLELEFLASEPYTGFVYADRGAATRAHAALYAAGGCEFGRPHSRVIRDGTEVMAMAAWLTGSELARCRLQGALTLARQDWFRSDVELRKRVQLAAATLLNPAGDELYLSRLAVSEQARGRGLSRLLLEACGKEGVRRSCRRIVLEVSDVHQAAAEVYRRAGFDEVALKTVEDPATGRRLCYRHMVKELKVEC